MYRLSCLSLVLALFAAAALAQNGTATTCFTMTDCSSCLNIPVCNWCQGTTLATCTDSVSAVAYCLAPSVPGGLLAQAPSSCLVPPFNVVPASVPPTSSDVNLTNGQLAGIIVGTIVATAIVVPGVILIIFFVFKALS